MVAKIPEFVKSRQDWLKNNIDTIILVVVVMLLVLCSFAAGYIMAKYQDRQPIQIQQNT